MDSIHERIPVRKLKQYQEIVGACHGKFKCNPRVFEMHVTVDVEFTNIGDFNEFKIRWRNASTDCVIKEKAKKQSFWNSLISRCKAFFA